MKFDAAPSKKKEKVVSTIEQFKTKEGDIVTLKWCIFRPSQNIEVKLGAGADSVLFLPGVAIEADSPSVVESAQNFANASKTPAFSISTRIDNPKTKNSQASQAEAVKAFLMSHGLRHVTVVGNSQGANKAIDLVSQIEKDNIDQADPSIEVRGIILTNPAGLYDQDPSTLTKNFFKDATLNTPKEVIKTGSLSKAGDAIRLGNSVTAGILKEAIGSPLQFSNRLRREGEEAATLNTNATNIKAPIVVVFGAKDIALGAKELIPETAHDQSMRAQEERGVEIRKVFSNSADIKVIEADKLSTHGLHYLRSESVANASIGMLERMERNK